MRRSLPAGRCSSLPARALVWALLAGLALCLNLACGTSAGQATNNPSGGSHPASSGSGTAGQASRQAFVYRGPADGSLPSCDAAQLAARPPPIVYRPRGLGSQPVPLLIALHGSGGTPQSMQGLSHFEQLANQKGFEVVFPASCDLTHPWGPPEDLLYVNSLIDQLLAAQNVDPSRVYVTGFSAGGYQTWLDGCRLSRKVAAIAIVSGAMNGRLYTSCSLSRPVSELLMVGTLDASRYTGIAGRLPSPFQTSARWRALDGCAPQPVTAASPLPAVSQQVWTACADGSAVSLILIQGAHHVWPPNGLGAPLNYSASEAIWAFLSAHTAAPVSLTTSDAKLLSLRAHTRSSGRTRFTATLRVAEPLSIVATLGSGSAQRTIHLTRIGQRTVTVSWSFAVARRSYRVVLTLRDPYGRTRTITRAVKSG
jgi:polyhydroxybutyrate depolymerase